MSKDASKTKKSNTKPVFAKKSLGQNFLIDSNYINKIISALDPQKDEMIIEIGVGRGALTEQLIEKSSFVIGIELDRDLIPIVGEKFADKENFYLLEKDALEIDFSELISNFQKNSKTKLENSNTKLVANLPYYISTAILQHLIDYRQSFSEMVLMLQKEVVERITAEAGKKERGFLSVLIQAYFRAEKIFDVPPQAFRPVPKVTSAVMRLITKDSTDIKNERLFRTIIATAFQQKRKTILNNLKKLPDFLYKNENRELDLKIILENLNIDPKRRAETLTLEEWRKLSNFWETKNQSKL